MVLGLNNLERLDFIFFLTINVSSIWQERNGSFKGIKTSKNGAVKKF